MVSTMPHRHRSRRDQDRGAPQSTSPAPSAFAGGFATPVGDYGGTIDAIVALVASYRARDRRDSPSRDRHSRRDLPDYRTGQECQLHLADRAGLSGAIWRQRSDARRASPTMPIASPCRKRPTGPPGHRHKPSLASSSGRGSAAASPSTGKSSSGPMRSPASGVTIRCPGRAAELDAGAACYCGRSGCIETFLSGPALAADHHRHCWPKPQRPGDRPGSRPRRSGVPSSLLSAIWIGSPAGWRR